MDPIEKQEEDESIVPEEPLVSIRQKLAAPYQLAFF